MAKLKKVLSEHQSKFVPKAWQNYTAQELSGAIGFFAKRSTHRSDKDKALKDIQDAENYLTFLREKTISDFS